MRFFAKEFQKHYFSETLQTMWDLAVNCPLEDLSSNNPVSTDPDPNFQNLEIEVINLFVAFLSQLSIPEKIVQLELLKEKTSLFCADRKCDCK